MNKMVNIIVPVYNIEKYLDECIESILNQTYQYIKLILVDDGSKDGSLRICQKWEQIDERVYAIYQDNQGVSKARNTGLDNVYRDYVLFVDGDDILEKTAVERLVEMHDKGSIVGTSVYRFSNSEEIRKPFGIDRYSVHTFRDLMNARGGYFCWGILYEYEIIRDYQIRFDENLRNLEDVVWNINYSAIIKKAAIVDDALYYYRDREESITTRCIDSAWQIDSWIKVLNSLKERRLPYLHNPGLIKEYIRCKNNVFAEAYCGSVSWKQVKKILQDNGRKSPFWRLEYYLSRLIFASNNRL